MNSKWVQPVCSLFHFSLKLDFSFTLVLATARSNILEMNGKSNIKGPQNESPPITKYIFAVVVED